MKSQDNIELVVKKCLQIINLYRWLLDSFVLDFYIDDHWNKLPTSWQECFKDMTPQTFGNIIQNRPILKVMPLSFLALHKSCSCYSIPRIPDQLSLINQDCINDKHEKLLTKHVKLKKRHEINLMAKTVAKISEETNCDLVVDFGSGLGHLVRTLSYKYNLKTIGLEQQKQLSEDARKLDEELLYTAQKYLDKKVTLLPRPTHMNTTVTFGEKLRVIDGQNYGLIGLHPCGDLGPNLINHFVENNSVKFICIVGCCYMKVNKGYPMSQFVQCIKRHDLSFESREIACHALEVYTDRLCNGDYHDLQVHSFRAMLEVLLVKRDPKLKHCGVRSIKHKKSLTFQRYCELATERLNVTLDPADINSEETNQKLSKWREVVIFYTCRLIMAPLIETVMLYDRLLHLWERGIDAEISPVFDPRISPRNHILVGRKF